MAQLAGWFRYPQLDGGDLSVSAESGTAEHMFGQSAGVGSDPEVIARFDELFERRRPSTTPQSVALVDRICAAARAENRAAVAQLVAIGELFGYRLSRCSNTEDWAIDTEEAVAAELAAALRISQALAARRLRMRGPCASSCRR